ncbi:hypothetical protein ACKWTF_010938 [Chironomus riparius]
MKITNHPVNLLEEKLVSLENELKNHTTQIAQRYYSNLISNCRSFSWNVINEITGRKKDDQIFVIETNRDVIFNSQDIAEAIQAKFSSTVCHESKDIIKKFLGKPHQ